MRALGQEESLFPSWGNEAGRQRFRLQQRAAPNLNRHLRRSVRRFVVLLAADIACATLAFAGVDLAWPTNVWSRSHPGLLGGAAPFVAAVLIGLTATGNYGPGDRRRSPGRLLVACTLACALLFYGELWSGVTFVPARLAVFTALLTWCAFVTERILLDHGVERFSSAFGPRAKTLFVGPLEACREVRSRAAFQPTAGYEFIGCVDTEGGLSAESIGAVADFARVLAGAGAETVVLCGSLSDRSLRTVVDTSLAAGCQILTVPLAMDVFGVQAEVVRRDGQVLVELTAPSVRGRQLLVKRLLDMVAAAAGLLALAPALALVALGVKLDSPGPVFFRQIRIGRGGRSFPIIKFRTMRVDAETDLGDLRSRNVYGDRKLFKVVGDPRVTRLGRILRRTSLDELPQLLNVLRGEMSLVGPRPPLPSEVAHYEEHHYGRLDMKPGITGPWQVAGRNLVTDFEEIVRLEREYTQNWDLTRDAVILLRTVPVVLRMRGAW